MELETNHCCKPFRNNGKRCSPKLRKLTDKLIEKLISLQCTVHLDTTFRICDSCRLYTYRHHPAESSEQPEDIEHDEELPSTSRNDLEEIEPEDIEHGEEPPSTSRYDLEEIPSAVSIISASSQESDLPDYSRAHNVELFNNGIAGINLSPISIRELKNVRYRSQKCSDVVSGIRKHLFSLPSQDDAEELDTLKTKAAAFDEIMAKLKEKYIEDDCSRMDKIRILTVLPNSWSVQQIMDEFETNKYIVLQAKELAAEKGLLATPNIKSGNRLDPEIKEEVLQFFEDDDISRAMPGQRDYVSVNNNGKRQQIQKRLLLTSLRETYKRYKELSKNKIGFSTFAALRPKHCKLLNASGSHNVCVCTIHENVDLMLHSLKKYSFKTDCKQHFEIF